MKTNKKQTKQKTSALNHELEEIEKVWGSRELRPEGSSVAGAAWTRLKRRQNRCPYLVSILITSLTGRTDNVPSHLGDAFAPGAPSAWSPLSSLLCGEHRAVRNVTAFYTRWRRRLGLAMTPEAPVYDLFSGPVVSSPGLAQIGWMAA